MKSIYKTLAVSGANLLALTVNAGDGTLLKPHFSDSSESNQVQQMSSAQMRQAEASHLEVFAGCKWGHAAFDPVQVASEEVPSEIQALHNLVS